MHQRFYVCECQEQGWVQALACVLEAQALSKMLKHQALIFLKHLQKKVLSQAHEESVKISTYPFVINSM